MANLSSSHLAILSDECGISEAVIQARGYRTVSNPRELQKLGFSRIQCRVPGLLLPFWTTDGRSGDPLYLPDHPRTVQVTSDGKPPDGTHPRRVVRYERPKGTRPRVDCPPMCRPMLADPSVPLWITTGQLKADALASQELCAVAVLQVGSWKGPDDPGGSALVAGLDHIALKGRDVRVVFDTEVMSRPAVKQALERLTQHLRDQGARVSPVHLPVGQASKPGNDNNPEFWDTLAELKAVIREQLAALESMGPEFELLDGVPPVLSRPLALIDGKAYAATWLPVRAVAPLGTNTKGTGVTPNPPKGAARMSLHVLRGDGRFYGDAGDVPLSDLEIEVHLREPLPPDLVWSSPGVKAYRRGYRPDPAVVFRRVCEVIDRFIDFDYSLADQQTMVELVACYVLSTYFLDAFSVTGYLWPNGDKGSGKTHLLLVVAALSYLGQVILPSGSYPSLRDLADFGATLAFDDAERFADSRKTDPDKRALLLAGNRRGNTVAVKERGPKGAWHTRYVNTYSARLFSAIHLPDPVLASRTIIVPLIRTPDPYRGNADPSNHGVWPHSRRELVDDLWALSVAHLSELPACEARVSGHARLTGRNLEPWLALLSVAYWLDGKGVSGLHRRMEALSWAYQSERPDFELDDFTVLVIRALCANCANHMRGRWQFASEDIKNEACKIISDDESTISPGDVTAQRIGMVLRRMRLKKPPRPGGKGPRKWSITIDELERWTKAYTLPLPPELAAL